MGTVVPVCTSTSLLSTSTCHIVTGSPPGYRIQDAAQERHPAFLKSWIPYSSIVEQMGTQRAPLSAFAPRSHAALAYADLWEEVQSALSPA